MLRYILIVIGCDCQQRQDPNALSEAAGESFWSVGGADSDPPAMPKRVLFGHWSKQQRRDATYRVLFGRPTLDRSELELEQKRASVSLSASPKTRAIKTMKRKPPAQRTFSTSARNADLMQTAESESVAFAFDGEEDRLLKAQWMSPRSRPKSPPSSSEDDDDAGLLPLLVMDELLPLEPLQLAECIKENSTEEDDMDAVCELSSIEGLGIPPDTILHMLDLLKDINPPAPTSTSPAETSSLLDDLLGSCVEI